MNNCDMHPVHTETFTKNGQDTLDVEDSDTKLEARSLRLTTKRMNEVQKTSCALIIIYPSFVNSS